MKAFEQNTIDLYAEKGKRWLDNLPNLILQVAETYGLSNLKPVETLSYNYVLSGFQDNRPIILKLGLDINGLKRESAALKAFSGFGAVQLITENKGLLLLECAVPGLSLKSYFPKNDDSSINIFEKIIKRLHKAPIPFAHTFPHIKDWLATLDKNWNIPAEYLQNARSLRDNLLQTSPEEVLLHGDLHHDNILQDGETWVAIDPKGVIGEPTYEVTAFIRNPIPDLLANDMCLTIINHRIARFANFFKLSERRIIDWCFVEAVLSWAWTLEDNSDDTYFKNLTKFFKRMIDVKS